MKYTNIIALVLITSLVIVIPLSYAEFSNPQKQLNSGVSLFDVQCNGDRVLADRSNDRIACVYESTAIKLNWDIIPTTQNIEGDYTIGSHNTILTTDENTNPISDKITSITNIGNEITENKIGNILGGYDPYFWPQYTLSFPEEVMVGEPFDVVLDYTFVIPDLNENELGEIVKDYEEYDERCEINYCIDKKIWIGRASNVDLIDRPDYELYHKGVGTKYTIEFSGESGTVHPTFDNTQSLSETFTLVINRPDNNYFYGDFNISFPQSGDESVYYHIAPDNVVYLSDEPQYKVGEGPSSLIEKPLVITPMEESNELHNMPVEVMEGLAEFLKEFHPDELDYESFLRAENLTEQSIEKFFELYPEMRVQNYLPSLHWILPQAYGAESFSFIYGNLKYYDSDGDKVALEKIKICAYDTETGTLTALYNGRTQVCAESSNNGSFSMLVPITDPNGSGGTDLILKAFSENSNFKVNISSGVDTPHTVTDNKSIPNLSTTIKSYGDFTLSSSQLSSKAFWVIDKLEPVRDWYISSFNYSPQKTNIVWDVYECPGVGIDSNSLWMELQHSYKIDERDNSREVCSNSINSPLSNQDTLSHEFAHIQFYRQYDLKNSAYPPYVPIGEYSPVLEQPPGVAWVEGWANFMAVAFSGSETFQPSYMVGQWDFEDRTHNEVRDVRFAGTPFVNGDGGIGNVAAALWDLVDTTNESGDDQSRQLTNIWNTMKDVKERDETVIAVDFSEFKNDWDDSSRPSLDSIFALNTLSASSSSSCDSTSSGFVFSDNFNCDFSQWTESGELDWEVVTPEERQRPGLPSTNTVANADNCDNDCILTMNDTVNLSSYSSSVLSFWRYIDSSVDRDEGLRVEINTGGSSWTEIGRYTDNNNSDNDIWTSETISLNGYLQNNVKLRFIAQVSSTSEEVEIDDVTIFGSDSGGGGGNPPQPQPDRPPVITTIPDVIMNEGETRTITIMASDPDGDSITYSLNSAPSYASLSGNIITLSPDYNDSGSTYIRVYANANHLIDSDRFDVTVNNVIVIPTAPLIPVSSDVSHNTVNISWTAPVMDGFVISGYEIFRSSSPSVLIATVGSDVTSYTDTTASPNTEYHYKIRAFDGLTKGVFSDDIVVTTLSPIPTFDVYSESAIDLNYSLKKLNDINYLVSMFPGSDEIAQQVPLIEAEYNTSGNNLLTNVCGLNNPNYSLLSDNSKLLITNNTANIIDDVSGERDNIAMFQHLIISIGGDTIPQYILDSIQVFEQRIKDIILNYSQYYNEMSDICNQDIVN